MNFGMPLFMSKRQFIGYKVNSLADHDKRMVRLLFSMQVNDDLLY